MTTPAPSEQPPDGSVACPRCGAPVGPTQDWCLQCGAAARTRLAATPNWRLPVAIVLAVVALAGVSLAIAFATLTGDEVQPATATTSTAAAPVVTAPSTPPVVAPVPATTPTEVVPQPVPTATTPASTVPPPSTVPAPTPNAPQATTPSATVPTTKQGPANQPTGP